MKKLIIFLLLPIKLFAVDYYVSNAGNDANNGLTTSTAWATLAKVNSFTYAANDRVLLHRGGTWYGSLIINRNNVTIDAYGSGSNPLITGYTLAGTWGNNIAGVWQVSTTAKATLNNVIVDGVQVAIGRYPNTGFLNYESIGSLSITDNQLTGSPNWTGAKAVIRKVRWIYDICPITSHSGSTLNYTNPIGVDNIYPGIANFGYFIQDDARTLDISGEWFLNKTTKILSMYFGSTQTSVVKYSTVDTVINIGAFANVTINNINVEGSNEYSIYAKNGSNITINNCSLNNNGGVGIYVWNIPNAILTNNTITNNLGNGIFCNNSIATTTLIQGNSINKAGYMHGMGGSGDNKNNGIWQNGNGATIQLNTIQNTGYNAIQYQGNNLNIYKNFINTYCTLADDGGGIYSWANNGLNVYSNRTVSSNIILNGIGAGLGTDKPTSNDARALYCDGGTNNVYFYNNTIINADAGAYLNNTVNVTLRNNTFYNVPIGISMQRFVGTQQLRTTDIKANIFYPITSNLFYWNGWLSTPPITIQNDIKALGVIDSNTYKSGLTAEFDWYYHQNADSIPDGFVDPLSQTFSQWKTYTLHDANSSTYSGTYIPYYNPTNAIIVINLSGTWEDPKGISYNAISLQPFSSILLKQISLPTEEKTLILKGVIFIDARL
jgi:hypothetical protein